MIWKQILRISTVFLSLLLSQSRESVKRFYTFTSVEGVSKRGRRKIADIFAKNFCSVANDIDDTRLLGMTED